jgi:hypothetical protein
VGHKAVHFAVFSQASLLAALLVSHVLLPFVIFTPRGVSNYGVYWPSVVPYTLGLGMYAVFVFFSARHYSAEYAGLRRMLYVLAALLAVVLFSTYFYKLSPALDTAHRLAGTALVSWQILIGYKFVKLINWRVFEYLLLLTMLASAVLMAMSLFTPAGFLSIFQVMFAAAFGVLYVSATAQLHRG